MEQGIDALAEEYWAHHLEVSPTHAHLLGIYERPGAYEEASREAEDRDERRLVLVLHGRSASRRYALIHTDGTQWLLHLTKDQSVNRG